jgi:hypothetical protein
MRSLSILLLICVSCTVFAQNKKAKTVKNSNSAASSSSKLRSKLAATTKYLSIGNAAISMPTLGFNGTAHPLVEVGFTKPFKKNSAKQRLTVGADAGYFFQSGLQSGLYLKPNLNFNFPIYKAFSIHSKIGAGLLLANNYNSEFALQSNGLYKNTSSLHPQFLGTIGLQPTLNVYNTKKYKYNVFMSYEFAAQTPFSAISSLLPMTMIRLGLKVQPTTNTVKEN